MISKDRRLIVWVLGKFSHTRLDREYICTWLSKEFSRSGQAERETEEAGRKGEFLCFFLSWETGRTGGVTGSEIKSFSIIHLLLFTSDSSDSLRVSGEIYIGQPDGLTRHHNRLSHTWTLSIYFMNHDQLENIGWSPVC